MKLLFLSNFPGKCFFFFKWEAGLEHHSQPKCFFCSCAYVLNFAVFPGKILVLNYGCLILEKTHMFQVSVRRYIYMYILIVSYVSIIISYLQKRHLDFFVDPRPSWRQAAAEAPTSSSGTLPVPPASARLPVTQLQLVAGVTCYNMLLLIHPRKQRCF